MEDPDVIADLRSLNTGQQSKYEHECDNYLNENTAVNDRRHGSITHIATAISIRDLIDQVKGRCPPDILIPSPEWVRLQFWPKTPNAKSAMHHTGRLKVKFKIQQRQWRHSHIDSHYAAASFRYMREYSLVVKQHSMFICLDDKHKIKVGEPNFPVASAERGRRVPVAVNESFQAGDHDFTKFGMIPSVSFIIDIPDTIGYTGQVHVGIKDSVFEPSSPIRHACELYNTLTSISFNKHILFLYSDGGPDHRLTFVSVQISLICLFFKLDLDYLCAGRTAPYHSWRNPVERVMSVLNLGLQCVALARKEMSSEFESEVSKCNNLAELRRVAEGKAEFKSAVQESLSPVKLLLSNIFSRLILKDRNISVFQSASENELGEFWSAILALDDTLQYNRKVNRDKLSTEHPKLSAFIEHCCRVEHYTFGILKCGSSTCSICKPVNLSMDVFTLLKHLPNPIPGEDGHYRSCSEVFGTTTSGEYRPSLTKRTNKSRGLPFYASVQHVNNCKLMVQCENCEQWRLVFSKYKLTPDQIQQLQLILDNLSYSCGSKLKDLDLPEEFSNVEIRDHAQLKNCTTRQNFHPFAFIVVLTNHTELKANILSVKTVVHCPQ